MSTLSQMKSSYFFKLSLKTYFLSKAFGYLIRIGIFYFEPSLLDKNIFLIFFFGMNFIDWIAISIAIIFQLFLFRIGMNFNRKLIKFSALTVYFGMLMFFLSVLLSDVKFTSKAFLEILDFDKKCVIDFAIFSKLRRLQN